MKYLAISTGTSPGDARPVFVSDDQELVALVLTCIALRLREREAEFALN